LTKDIAIVDSFIADDDDQHSPIPWMEFTSRRNCPIRWTTGLVRRCHV
jgi:hypothetical protein